MTELTLVKILRTGETPKNFDAELARMQLSAEVEKRRRIPNAPPKRTWSKQWDKFRQDAVKKWGSQCSDCKEEIKQEELDIAHILPYELFPEYKLELWNVRPKHRSCHKKEPTLALKRAYQSQEGLRNVLEKLGGYSSSYFELSEDITNIKVEYSFRMRWDLVEMYHKIGLLIAPRLKELDLVRLSYLTAVSERNLYRAAQFAEKYPDLALLPEGKNTSWHRIANKYLPEPKEKQECDHEYIEVCKKCHQKKSE